VKVIAATYKISTAHSLPEFIIDMADAKMDGWTHTTLMFKFAVRERKG